MRLQLSRIVLCAAAAAALTTATTTANAGLIDTFESGAFSPAWANTNIATIVNDPGNGAGGSDYYAKVTGALVDGDTLGAYFVNSTTTTANWFLEFDFRFTDTNQRQLNVQVGSLAAATNNSLGPMINFAYDGADNRFKAFNGSTFQELVGLPTNLADGTWHDVKIVGRDFGTAAAEYDVTVNGTTQTGFTIFHAAFPEQNPTINEAGGFNFNDRFGNNPGFDVDNVAVGVPEPTSLLLAMLGYVLSAAAQRRN